MVSKNHHPTGEIPRLLSYHRHHRVSVARDCKFLVRPAVGDTVSKFHGGGLSLLALGNVEDRNEYR
jgi:hypothetical protein